LQPCTQRKHKDDSVRLQALDAEEMSNFIALRWSNFFASTNTKAAFPNNIAHMTSAQRNHHVPWYRYAAADSRRRACINAGAIIFFLFSLNLDRPWNTAENKHKA
jgi:hypothetical protein